MGKWTDMAISIGSDIQRRYELLHSIFGPATGDFSYLSRTDGGKWDSYPLALFFVYNRIEIRGEPHAKIITDSIVGSPKSRTLYQKYHEISNINKRYRKITKRTEMSTFIRAANSLAAYQSAFMKEEYYEEFMSHLGYISARF